MPKRIKVVTLNVGRGYLNESCDFLQSCEADVICLQDLQERHIGLMINENLTARFYAPMTNHWVKGRERSNVGIGIFSRFPMKSVFAHAYLGHVQPVLDLKGIDVDHDTGETSGHRIEEVRATESRMLLVAEIDVNGTIFTVGTTHGTWVKGGVADEVQIATMSELVAVIQKRYSDLVMAGDFNPDKDGKVLAILNQVLMNQMPPSVNNTLDKDNHPLKGKFNVIADFFFTKGKKYQVTDVEVHSGVSDHCALSATVTHLD